MVALMNAPLRMERFRSVRPENRERRMFPRKTVHARIEARRLDHTILAHRSPRLSLELNDLSIGGLSASADLPLQAGERLSVFFPPAGAMHGWDAYGRVVRCEPSSMGYRVALEFDPLPAA
jgi:hypothetical protein